MMQILKNKFITAGNLFRLQGFGALRTIFDEKKTSLKKRVRRSKQYKWCLGRLVELRGNVVEIEKLSFNLNNPAVSTGMKSHFLFNNYEKPERESVKKYLDKELPIIELGGAVGVVSCLANRRLKNPARHVVIEANPDLISLLEENRNRNDCHFTVLHRALAYDAAEISFNVSSEFWESNLSSSFEKTVTVSAISIEDIATEFNFERFTLICDIEGAEVDLVERESELLKRKAAVIILEVHPLFKGAALIEAMLNRLEEIGFVRVFERPNNFVLHNRLLVNTDLG